MNKEKIAFLGMGVMGAAMAANLLKGGFCVLVCNRSMCPSLAKLARAGATVFTPGSAHLPSGGSRELANLGPRILKENFAPGFSLRNVIKDRCLVFDNLS